MEAVRDFVGRVWVAGLVSAALGVGGVWFVVEQSLASLCGHVASIDSRLESTNARFDDRFDRMDGNLDRFITKREFDQFLDRFTRFEERVEEQFELTRTVVSTAAREVRAGRFRLLDDRVEAIDGAVIVDMAGLTPREMGFLFGKLVQQFPPSGFTPTIDDVATILDQAPFRAEVTGTKTVSVRTDG